MSNRLNRKPPAPPKSPKTRASRPRVTTTNNWSHDMLSWNKAVNAVARNALAPSTQSNYRSAWKRFLTFCKENNIHASLRHPADELVICAFATSQAGLRAGGTVANQIAGLKTWHTIHNLPWNGGPCLSYVLKGIANMSPTSSKRPPRPPITAEMIRRLHDALDTDKPEDAATFAVATTAFWGQCRLGELLASSRRDTRNPSLPTVASLDRHSSTNGTRHLHLPRTKTNRINGQKIVLTRQDRRADPIRAIALLLQANNRIDHMTHLFAFRTGPLGEFRSPTKESFLKRINDIWSPMGYPRVTGHCFRIGGTTELLQNGVPVDLVKSMGRWKSDAFQRYWRGIGELAAKHVEFLRDRPNAAIPARPTRSSARARRQATAT